METQKLTDITRGLYHAASTTNAMVAQQYILMIDQFFDRLSDGTLQAKTARVAVDDQHYMNVPLVSLVAPRGLALEKMQVRLTVKMEDAKALYATSKADNSQATRSSFTVSLSPKSDGRECRHSDTVDITLDFVASPPPEAVMRIIDQYANQIQPVPLQPNDKPYPAPAPVNIKPGEPPAANSNNQK